MIEPCPTARKPLVQMVYRRTYAPRFRLTHCLTAICLCLLLGLTAPHAVADDHRFSAIGEWQFEIALGYWQQDNPLREAETQIHYLVPHVAYYGKRVFVENLTLGFALQENRQQRWAFLATPSEDYLYFYFADHDYVTTVMPRDRPPPGSINAHHEATFHYLTGIEYTRFNRNWEWSWNLLGSSSEGRDYYVGHLQALRYWQAGEWRIEANAAARYASADYVDSFYGATLMGVFDSSVYYGRPTWSFALGVEFEFLLAKQWSWLTHYRVQRLGDGIAKSPLIAEAQPQQFFTGLLFTY